MAPRWPLVAVGDGTAYPRLEQLLHNLGRDGIGAHPTEVSYEFQHGVLHMLVGTRS